MEIPAEDPSFLYQATQIRVGKSIDCSWKRTRSPITTREQQLGHWEVAVAADGGCEPRRGRSQGHALPSLAERDGGRMGARERPPPWRSFFSSAAHRPAPTAAVAVHIHRRGYTPGRVGRCGNGELRWGILVVVVLWSSRPEEELQFFRPSSSTSARIGDYEQY